MGTRVAFQTCVAACGSDGTFQVVVFVRIGKDEDGLSVWPGSVEAEHALVLVLHFPCVTKPGHSSKRRIANKETHKQTTPTNERTNSLFSLIGVLIVTSRQQCSRHLE